MDFAKVEAQFKDLREQFDNGRFTLDEFKSKLFDMMVQDDQGNWWMIGYESGQWYRHDGSQWQLDTPPAIRALPSEAPPERKVTENKEVATTEKTLSLDLQSVRIMEWWPVILQASALLVVTLFMLVLDINDLTDNTRIICCYLLFYCGISLATLSFDLKNRTIILFTSVPAALFSALVLCLFLDDFYSPLSESPIPQWITTTAAVLVGLGTLIPAFRPRQPGAIVLGAAALLQGLVLYPFVLFGYGGNKVFVVIGFLGGLSAIALTLLPVLKDHKQPEL